MTDISGINRVNDGFTEHYTPTTEQIRDYLKDKNLIVEFDRWLNEVKAQAWEEGCSWGVSNFHILKDSYKTNPNREEK